MTRNIQCRGLGEKQNIKVKVIKAPLVNTSVLREIMSQRQKAIVI